MGFMVMASSFEQKDEQQNGDASRKEQWHLASYKKKPSLHRCATKLPTGRVILTHAPLYTLTNHERERVKEESGARLSGSSGPD